MEITPEVISPCHIKGIVAHFSDGEKTSMRWVGSFQDLFIKPSFKLTIEHQQQWEPAFIIQNRVLAIQMFTVGGEMNTPGL